MSGTVVRILESGDVPQVHAIYSEPGACANTLQLPRRRHVATLGMGVKATARGTGVGSFCSKHGFEIEGTRRRYAFRDGHHVDVHVMARIGQGSA